MSLISKKIAGTLFLLAVIAGGSFAAMPEEVRATFINSIFGLNVDGIVDQINDSMLILLTNGSEPLYINISNRTRIINGPVQPGDQVKVIARISGNGNITARIIRRANEGQYGTKGDPVIVQKANVVSKGDDFLVVESNVGEITFAITPRTRFVRKSFEHLEPGDMVRVIGRDSGSEFVARLVISRHGRWGHGSGGRYDSKHYSHEYEHYNDDYDEYEEYMEQLEEDVDYSRPERPTREPRAPRAPREPRNW